MAHFAASFSSASVRPERHQAGAACLMAEARHHAEPNEHRPGPGWFDSSWELQRGLDVREGLPDDVKPHEWIEVCLSS
jgi:hypothetical protein